MLQGSGRSSGYKETVVGKQSSLSTQTFLSQVGFHLKDTGFETLGGERKLLLLLFGFCCFFFLYAPECPRLSVALRGAYT